jgi:hypothetical protein
MVESRIHSVYFSRWHWQFSIRLFKVTVKTIHSLFAKLILDRFFHEEKEGEKSETERLALKPLPY